MSALDVRLTFSLYESARIAGAQWCDGAESDGGGLQSGWLVHVCVCVGGYVRVSVCVCVVWLLHLCHATLLSRTSASYRTQLCVAATCSLAMQQASSV